MKTDSTKNIWIDIYNTPHVPFFKPITKKLTDSGINLFITSRDCAQVSTLSKLLDFPYNPIGKHSGKHTLLKAISVLYRTLLLMISMRKKNVDLALAHGSRSQLIAAKLLGIPTAVIMDYEHAMGVLELKPDWMIVPEIIPAESFEAEKAVMQYPGIKEDVYVQNFKPDNRIYDELNIPADAMVVSIRPPATEAHYHNHTADELFSYLVNYLSSFNNLYMVVLPRYESQAAEIRKKWKEFINAGTLIIPEKALDGLNLIWYSDFVVSGGGTMNREAAALGVPVYSIFMGEIGAVDQYLSRENKLFFLKSIDDIDQKLSVTKREKPDTADLGTAKTMNAIVAGIEQILNNTK